MTTTLKPTPGNLVVERLPEEEKTASGLYMVGTQEKSASVVRVLAINPPVDEDPENYFKVGDHLIVGKWQGTEVTVGRGLSEKKFMIINESSVLATLENFDGETGSSSGPGS